MKKKIIFVTKALWIGGIETALINLLNFFDYDKYDVTLLVTHAELDLKESVNPNCRLIVVDREKKYSFGTEYKYNRLFHLTEKTDNPSIVHKLMMWIIPFIRKIENELYIKYIKKLMGNEKYDTAIIYNDIVAEITVKAIKAEKYLMYYHHGAMRHVYHDYIGYKKSNSIIAVSENQADSLRLFVPKYKDKIITIHNLIDIDKIKRLAQEPVEEVFDDSKYNIVTVGRVSQEKGIDIAVNICSNIVRRGYDNVRWWIIGDGPEMDSIKLLISDMELDKYMILVGMKSNPYPYMVKADLYVQPSRIESFGISILEALVLGKTVVATNTLGGKEIKAIINTDNLCISDDKKMADMITDYLEKNEKYNDEKCLEQIRMVNKSNMEILEKLI